jgi:hypothetical protein
MNSLPMAVRTASSQTFFNTLQATSYTPKALKVKQLNGFTIPALGYGLNPFNVQHPSANFPCGLLITCLPMYLFPFSFETLSTGSTSLYKSFTILLIDTSDGERLIFPSLPL